MRRTDWSISAIAAGLLAVLISYTGPLVIFYQAAQVAGMPNDAFASWIWAISIGAAVSGILLSYKLKVPVITAWSAPGTALLITLFPGLPLQEAIGAYLTAAAILLLVGLTGYFDRLIERIPKGIASGMMAGILFQFALNAFKAFGSQPVIAASMVAAFLVLRRFWPRYCIVFVLILGVALAMATGHTNFSGLTLEFVMPQVITPEWSWSSTFSLALPLVLVTLTGQYLPGMAVLKVSGYDTSMRPIITTNSLVSLVVAPFGGITIAIAAITAAMCTGSDAHENPEKRYIAGIANGAFYLLGGLFGGVIVLLFSSLPKELVAVLAGLALLGAITTNLAAIVDDEKHREASVITFAATASGMSFLGLGAAFWGIVIGMLAYVVLQKR